MVSLVALMENTLSAIWARVKMFALVYDLVIVERVSFNCLTVVQFDPSRALG